jgi:hypothetical protein
VPGAECVVELTNKDSAAIYVGGSEVATGTGQEMVANAVRSYSLLGGEALYAIASATPADVRVAGSGLVDGAFAVVSTLLLGEDTGKLRDEDGDELLMES